MSNLIKNLKFSLLTLSVSLFVSSCSVAGQESLTYPKVNSVDLKLQKSFDLKLNISNLGFKTKAELSGPEDPPATNLDKIKSFDAFLTTNYNNPLAPGANPFGNNYIIKVNYNPKSTTIMFPAVPAGGPYYAVIAAYDSDKDDVNRKNITYSDPSISSNNKRWSRSSNNVSIARSQISFSDLGTKLKVKLKLSKPNGIGVDIIPIDGEVIGNPVLTEN